MTRPGAPSSRGRHAAPDEGARAGGRHAATEETEPRRHSAQDVSRYSAEPALRRHGAPEDDPPGRRRPVNGQPVNGQSPYGQPVYGQPYGRASYDQPLYDQPRLPLEGPVNGHRVVGPADRHGTEGVNGHRVEGPVPLFPLADLPHGYRVVDPADGYPADDAGGRVPPDGYQVEGPVDGYRVEGPQDGYRVADPADGYRAEDVRGRFRVDGPVDGQSVDGTVGGFEYRRPEPVDRYRLDEPSAPSANGYRPGEPSAPPANGYRLGEPSAPPADGYRLGEPVPPVTGFPYTALPPDAPTAWTVNGRGVDRAERDAAAWPVNGHTAGLPPAVNGHGVDRAERDAAVWPVNGHATDLPPAANRLNGLNGVNGLDRQAPVNGHAPAPLTSWQRETVRPAYPPTKPREEPAPLTLDDESTQHLRRYIPAGEVFDREAEEPQAGPDAPHPPRAVVRRRRARRRALEWPFLIVFALVSAYLIRAYVVQTFYIPSGSMHETLIEGDRVLVNKVSYHLHDVNRGDVVVFRRPPDFPVDDDDLIKRVVATPGETVEAHGGKVYVDGAPLTEPYVEPICRGTRDFPQVTVPPGKLWVMGDNRCNSSDSRVFGPIDEHLVVGRAFVLAWPAGRLSWL